jgi:menaquinone-dependent protoporphyrinogen oxidase
MRVLVVYASRHGSTQGIAEHIAATLNRPGIEVVLRLVDRAERLDGLDRFDAFVIGSAAYLGGWLDDATSFVRRHRTLLASRPVWLFSSGPTGTSAVDAKGRDVLEASAPKEFAEFERSIRPNGTRVFFGAYDPDAAPVGLAERVMGRFLRAIPEARRALPTGDFRDWPAIEAWAESIAHELEPIAATATAGA